MATRRADRRMSFHFVGELPAYLTMTSFEYQGRPTQQVEVSDTRARAGYQAFGLLAVESCRARAASPGRPVVGRLEDEREGPARTLYESLKKIQGWHDQLFGELRVNGKAFVRVCTRTSKVRDRYRVTLNDHHLSPSEIRIHWEGQDVTEDATRLRRLAASIQQHWSELSGYSSPSSLFVGADDPLSVPAAAGALLANIRYQQQIKNIIANADVSKRLLEAKDLPTLLECIIASEVYAPRRDEEKDRPLKEDLGYNHFFQLSAVLFWSDQKDHSRNFIGYLREPKATISQFVHTQGLSVLWAGSYGYNLYGRPDIMDAWVRSVARDEERAARQMVGGKSPILLQILEYKLSICDATTSILPLGVVTKDERPKSKRVYTQYVFLVELLPTEPIVGPSEVTETIDAPDVCVLTLPTSVDPHTAFTNHKGDKNLMDILVWQALHSSDARLEVEAATFRRGMIIL